MGYINRYGITYRSASSVKYSTQSFSEYDNGSFNKCAGAVVQGTYYHTADNGGISNNFNANTYVQSRYYSKTVGTVGGGSTGLFLLRIPVSRVYVTRRYNGFIDGIPTPLLDKHLSANPSDTGNVYLVCALSGSVTRNSSDSAYTVNNYRNDPYEDVTPNIIVPNPKTDPRITSTVSGSALTYSSISPYVSGSSTISQSFITNLQNDIGTAFGANITVYDTLCGDMFGDSPTDPQATGCEYGTASYTLPTFNLNDGAISTKLIKFLRDGDISDTDNYSEFEYVDIPVDDISTAVDWVFFINGDREPNCVLQWNSNSINNLTSSYPNIKEDVKVEVVDKGIRHLYSYNLGSVKIPWEDNTDSYEVSFSIKIPYRGGVYGGNAHVKVPIIPPSDDYGVDTTDGSTLQVIYNSDPNSDVGYNFDTETTDDDITDGGTDTREGISVGGAMSTCYLVSGSTLKNLSNFIWNDDLFDEVKLWNNSPIENIVSIKYFPANGTGEGMSSIVVGNITTGLSGNKISKNIVQDVGSIDIPSYYNNFLDYAPFTKISIFLPFCGFHTLDANEFIGRTLKVKYIHDILTGACKACLYANNIYICSFDGISGVDVPITASNRAQIEAGLINSAVGGFAKVATGFALGGGVGAGVGLIHAVGNTIDSAMAQYHYSTVGKYSPSIGNNETNMCYLIVDRPVAQYSKSYNHDYGRPCNLTYTLGILKGFTICNPSVDISGVQATDIEMEEIREYLTTGIYL